MIMADCFAVVRFGCNSKAKKHIWSRGRMAGPSQQAVRMAVEKNGSANAQDINRWIWIVDVFEGRSLYIVAKRGLAHLMDGEDA